MSAIAERLAAALADRYRIERELGAGGMATVFLAEDLKHKRKVALKMLKPELAAVLGAERFVQEITTTAALQHPHILPLFDSGTADGFLYYVMPFIDGETLRAKLDRETQLGVDEAVRIASDVASALHYAHTHGVIHRDIKPENILLHDGRPMVADFGIALAVSAAAGGRMTETGLSLGTPHYMSPEQATAEKEISARSDVYSLASVLYEMLAGQPPHLGGSAQQIIMKIISEQPAALTTLRKSVPSNVAAAVAKALEKLPADRFESAKEFATALSDPHFTTRTIGSAPIHGTAAALLPSSMRTGWLWAAGLLAIGATAGWMLRPGQAAAPAPVTRFTIPVPSGQDISGTFHNLAVSPDGQSLAYFVGSTLYRRRFDRDEPDSLATLVTGCCPSFSRDGRSIFVARGVTYNGREILSVPADGGTLADMAARPIGEDMVGASWNGTGVFLRRGADTTWSRIGAPDSGNVESAQMWPQLLDEGRSVLFTAMGPSMMWHGASIVLVDVASGARMVIARGATDGRYVRSGHVVYIRDNGSVEALPFDLRNRRVTGSAITVATGVETAYWGGAGAFDVSDAGTFAFVRGSSWQRHRLTWLDRQGKVTGYVGQPVTVEGVRLSPDERYAVTYVASPSADIARFDIGTGEQRRLTFDASTEDWPTWTADGRRVVYRRIVSGNDQRIVARRADGQGDVEQIYASTSGATVPLDWSPDGSALALGDQGIRILHLVSKRVDTVTTGEGHARFSPDGRWIAYTTPQTGRDEIYVKPYPSLASTHQVSVNGGRLPMWSAKSGELFFVAGDSMMVSAVSTRSGFDWTTPTLLFASPDVESLEYPISVSADGKRFLVPTRNRDSAPREIHVVLNWFEELKAKAKPQ